MTSIELKDRLTKAEEKVTKCENTIERHMKQLEKRQAKLLRVEWMAQYMEDLKAVMWDEEKRFEYKRATGDDLYWDCCDVQSKEEDIKGAKRKLEDQKEVSRRTLRTDIAYLKRVYPDKLITHRGRYTGGLEWVE